MPPKTLGVKRVSPEGDVYVRYLKWVEGPHPEMGELTVGWTGQETLVHIQGVRPQREFTVSQEKEEL